MPASPLEMQWDDEMHVLYKEGVEHCGYHATYFLQLVQEHGGVAAARILLKKDGISEGLKNLWQLGRLDLTMETRMFQRDQDGHRKWQSLFTREEFDTAEKRLVELQYQPALNGSL